MVFSTFTPLASFSKYLTTGFNLTKFPLINFRLAENVGSYVTGGYVDGSITAYAFRVAGESTCELCRVYSEKSKN